MNNPYVIPAVIESSTDVEDTADDLVYFNQAAQMLRAGRQVAILAKHAAPVEDSSEDLKVTAWLQAHHPTPDTHLKYFLDSDQELHLVPTHVADVDSHSHDPDVHLIAPYFSVGEDKSAVIRDIFETLADEWEAESRLESSFAQIFGNDKYLQIIGLGPLVLPHMLERFRAEPERWVGALKAVTRSNPATDESSREAVIDAWEHWVNSHTILGE